MEVPGTLARARRPRRVERRAHSVTWVAAALVAGAGAGAQQRPAPTTGRATNDANAAPAARCTLRPRPLLPQPAGPIPDQRVPPAAVRTAEGLLVAWRSVDNAVWLSRLDPRYVRRGDDRELARAAGPFAMTAAPGGAALVLVEATRDGRDNALLLARINGHGEARNVPREIARARAFDHVAIEWASSGHIVAWSSRADATNGTFILATDARGVPRAGARRVGDAATPSLAHLAGEDATLVNMISSSGRATGLVVDAQAAGVRTVEWPAGARGVASASDGQSWATIVTGAGDEAAQDVSVAVWNPAEATPTVSSTTWRASGQRFLAQLVAERSGLLAVFDEAGGRESIVRFAADGSATLLAVRPGTRGAIVRGDDASSVTVVGHEPPPAGAGRLAIVELQCAASSGSAPSSSGPGGAGSSGAATSAAQGGAR